MIATRYGHLVAPQRLLITDLVNSKGNKLTTENTNQIRDRSREIRGFYDLLTTSLLEIEYMDSTSIDSFIDPSNRMRVRGYGQEPVDSFFAEEIRSALKKPIISYIVFRTLGKHARPIRFRENDFPTYAHLVVHLADEATEWMSKLAYYAVAEPGDTDVDEQQHRLDVPANKTEARKIRLEIRREHSWAEEIVQENPLVPSDPIRFEESREQEIDRIAKRLSGGKGPIFRFLVRHPDGVTFEQLKVAEDDETKRRLTKSDNNDSIAVMMRKLSQLLEPFYWSVSASQESNLIKVEKLGESKT